MNAMNRQKLLLKPTDLHDYQQRAVAFQCERPESALWLDMGLGKTAITLTSINYLRQLGALRAVLIVAPIRVCRLVWRQEALKWTHTQGLRFAMVVGDKDQRIRQLNTKADIYLINYENLEWLTGALNTYYVNRGLPIPFDGIVYDEITNCKNSNTHRVKSLRKILHLFRWRTGLTGTPAGNGYRDLHGQYLVLDEGKRLGTSKTHFEQMWYRKDGPYKRIPYADTGERIKELIGDMTLEMSAEEYNKLPDMIVNDVVVELPDELRATYDRMEDEMFIELDSGKGVEIFNKGVLMNKCLQFANGAMYPEAGNKNWEAIHDIKLDALAELIDESNGQSVLCAYQYQSDAQRIMERFKKLCPINLTDCKSERALTAAMEAWRTGNCQLMIGHPASMGHGLDGLQKHGHILAWFGITWSLEKYLQFIARIRRQGQGVPVICHRIICLDTVDMIQVMAIEAKATTETALRQAVRQYRHQRGK